MSIYGYLACKDCREVIFLGKWLRDEQDNGLGFWHGRLCREGEANSQRLGEKVLRFIAKHMDHELFAGSDGGGLVSDLDTRVDRGEEEQYRNVDAEYGDPD